MLQFSLLSRLLGPQAGYFIFQIQQLYFFRLKFLCPLFKHLRAVIAPLYGLLEVIFEYLDFLLQFRALPPSRLIHRLQLIDLRVVLAVSLTHHLIFINECPLFVI